MKTKSKHPISHLEKITTLPIIQLYYEFSHLKHLYRQGWLKKGIPPTQCESVAEHSFGVALLALFLAEAYFFDLDLGKLISMALIHDFGEIYAGDFTPTDEVSPEEKHRLERESIEAVFGKLANGEKYVALWLEFETSDSPEARLIRQLDKLEMALQASLYEHQHNVDLSEFYDSANTAISDEALRKISTSLWDLSAHSD